MPTTNPGDKVLVTGANGYVAIWVVKTLLEKGYSVRAAVRSEGKGQYLKDHFKAYAEKFELAVVPEITKDGAFDEAVKGVDGVEHIASPFVENLDDPKDFIEPAVRGTIGVLQSAVKNGPTIKRIVITSSTVSIVYPPTKPTSFSEKDWNEQSITDVEREGRSASGMQKYRASKTLAEKAAWDFHSKHKDQIKWDLSVLNPPYVFGPPLHQVNSPESLNTSLQHWYDTVVLDTPKTRDDLSVSNAWVDVRDLADAHVRALETEAAGGERIIVSQGNFVWQDWLDVANSLHPPPVPSYKLPRGIPDMERVYNTVLDTSKEARIFGIKHRSKEDTTRDLLLDFAKRGW